MSRFSISMVTIALAIAVSGKKGYGPGEQDWGFVDVREGAHMFYWLYYTTAKVSHYTERPLAIWLQGGPGASSTGIGNFLELGPFDLYGNYRNHTWVKDMNILFIDNPVGSGFSYVDNLLKLTQNNKEIALDLVELMKGFYKRHPEFAAVPLHIFCQSYGGKTAPEFVLELYKATKRGEVSSNLKSVNLGSPWISPIDSVLSYAPLLLQMGIVDENGFENIMIAANITADLVNAEKWYEARGQWENTKNVVRRESKGVNFYNIQKPTRDDSHARLTQGSERKMDLMNRSSAHFNISENRIQVLENLMLGPVSEALNIPSKVKWGSQSNSTLTALKRDFMKPVIHIVTELLDYTDIQVTLFSGQLDLICATPGAVKAIAKMLWSHKSDYVAAERVGINVNHILEGYEKSGGNFTMFWINHAGHNIPIDNPAAMGYILRKVTRYDEGF